MITSIGIPTKIVTQDVAGGIHLLRENVPQTNLHRHNRAHLYLKLGRYGDNQARKISTFCGNTYCTCNMVLRTLRRSVLEPTAKPSHTEECALRKDAFTGSPRLINTVESTKVNRVNSFFQRKWSAWLTGEQVGDGQLSFNVVNSLWMTHHRLTISTSKSRPVPQCRTSRTSVFPLISFFLKCFDILSLNSHISQHHLPAQVHLPPFWNRLPRPMLNSISLIQPRWSTWGTRINAP